MLDLSRYISCLYFTLVWVSIFLKLVFISWSLLYLHTAQLLDVVNIASVTIALPSILRDVGYQPTQLQW